MEFLAQRYIRFFRKNKSSFGDIGRNSSSSKGSKYIKIDDDPNNQPKKTNKRIINFNYQVFSKTKSQEKVWNKN